MSIDQLTEEAEADLANNNDPNNNSSNNEENQIGKNMPQQQKFREIGIGKTASIESNITTIINYFAFFPYTDQHLQHEQQQQQQQQEEIQNSRQSNFGRMASYRYLILLVIINLTKTY